MSLDNLPDWFPAALALIAMAVILWAVLQIIGERKVKHSVVEIAQIDLDNPPQKEKHRYLVAPSSVQEALKLVADPRMEAHTDQLVSAWLQIEQGAYWFAQTVGTDGYRIVGRGFISQPIEEGFRPDGWCVTHQQTAMNDEQCFFPFYRAYSFGFGKRQRRKIETAKKCKIVHVVVAHADLLDEVETVIDGSKDA